jgi:hypothetical protein
MSASFPAQVKIFQFFVDGFNINYAAHIDELHDEVVAIETFIGTTEFSPIPFPDIVTMLLTMYAGTTPLPHTHAHDPSATDGMYLTDLGSDTHSQYPRADGVRGFSAPVPGKDALVPTQLATKHQVDAGDASTLSTAEQFATNAANSALQQAEQYTITYTKDCVRSKYTSRFPPINGPVLADGTGLIEVGGTLVQQSDGDSLIYISFEGSFTTTLQSMTVNIMDEAEAWPLAGPGFGFQGYGAWPQFTTFHVEAWNNRSAAIRLGWAGDAAIAAGTSVQPNGTVNPFVTANNGVHNLGLPAFSPLPGYWIRLCFTALGH